MPFQTPVDIANQGLQYLGQGKILSFADTDRQALECSSAYDNGRLAELANHTWMFSIRHARVRGITQSMQRWTPPTYNPATDYTIGQVVMYAGGTYANSANYPWIMQAPSGTGLQPDISTQWSHFFGTLCCDVFDNQARYAAGEVVLVPEAWQSANTYANATIINYQGVFYVSLAGTNLNHIPSSTIGQWWVVWVAPENTTVPITGTPAVAPQGTYSAGTTYAEGAIVSYTSTVTGNVQYYISLVGSNIGNEPDTSPSDWSLWGSSTSQGLGSPLGPFIWSDFNGGPGIWLSLTNNNGSTNPSVTPASMPFTGSPNWTNVGGTIQQLTVLWPASTGYLDNTTTLNLFPLPFGWLRPNEYEQHQRDSHPWLGAFYGEQPKDFVYYDEYFTSWGQGPWDVEFVADIADVTRMHVQFCHCVALNMAQVMDQPLTEGKNLTSLIQKYNKRVGDAQRVDAILQGTPDEPLEEFVRVRL
jgi:hypothetical protein